MKVSSVVVLVMGLGTSAGVASAADPVATVTRTPGLVALWDFVRREPDGHQRFVAHVPPGSPTDYPLDEANYVRDLWGRGRIATAADFPELGRGPFGNAIRIVREADPDFRPLLLVPRERLHGTPLDIKGPGRSVSVVVWAIRESGNHALAGIWHEGTDLVQPETAGVRKVQRGQRQYALFAGLNKEGSACGHVSENGVGSFRNRYALHKCNSAGQAPAVPADADADVLDRSWRCFAMTLDHETAELTGWLDGVAGDRWLDNPRDDRLLSSAYEAYRQGYFAGTAEREEAEDPTFPADQYYRPPEGTPVAIEVLAASDAERVELRQYRFTKVRVTSRNGREVSRELVAIRLNPWWYPHGIHAPPDDGSGGPFTIGRVIHSSRGIGFTGWIGGVAVFDRPLRADELARLSTIATRPAGDLPP